MSLGPNALRRTRSVHNKWRTRVYRAVWDCLTGHPHVIRSIPTDLLTAVAGVLPPSAPAYARRYGATAVAEAWDAYRLGLAAAAGGATRRHPHTAPTTTRRARALMHRAYDLGYSAHAALRTSYACGDALLHGAPATRGPTMVDIRGPRP